MQTPGVSPLQLAHEPWQPVLQQTPSVHEPAAHSAAVVHGVPDGLRATQVLLPVSQNAFARQCAFVVQVVRQEVPSQAKRPHEERTSVQSPAPLHSRLMSGASEVVHSAPPQASPFVPNAHRPAPSQEEPQGGVPTHSLAGSSPAETKVHVPTLPPRLQDSQVPPHSASQQTPSAQ